MNVCNSCEHNKNSILGPKCEICECPLNLKVYLTIAKCPLDKWEAVGSFTREGFIPKIPDRDYRP